MSSRRGHFKDRILEGIAKAIKEVHAFSYSADGEIVTVTNDDRPLQKLVERLDHAFLHGLKNVTRGYWGVAKLFAHRGIIEEISKLDRLTTDLGRSRAWLYKSLNDTSLESYLRCFQENPSTMRKYYVETGMLRDMQRVNVLQTLIAGLDYITFDLEINIAYFDLVSYIPRSASISEPEDDITTPSNDSVPTTPSTPATIPDSISSIANSEPFSPMDESPQSGIRSPTIVIKNRSTIEKRHSFPQHYSEIDATVPPLVETHSQEAKGDFNCSFSAGKIIEGKPTRPATLGVPSRNERSLSSDASLKSMEEGFDGSDLKVTRLKNKKTKKGHKKKKRGDRTSLDRDKLTRNGSSGTLSSMCDEIESPSPRLEAQAGDSISKCSSCSSLQSFSDRGSLNEATNLGRFDADSLSGISFDDKTEIQQDKSTPNELSDGTDGMIDLEKLIKEIDEKTTNLRREVGKTEDTNDPPPQIFTKEDFDFGPRSFDSDIQVALPNSSNLAKHQPEIIRPDVKADLAPTIRASLNFDETVSLTLSTLQEATQGDPPSSQDLSDLIRKKDSVQSPSQSDLNSSLSTVPSETVASFASLFTETASPTSLSLEDPLSHPSPSSSSYSASDISANPSEEGLNETSGSSGQGVRSSSSDANSSFKELMEADERTSEVVKEMATMATLDVVCESHEAEIEVDNNLKLYLMLEVFKKEHEEFKKLIRMSTGHMEGDLQPAFILLTDHMLYILRRGDKQGHYSTQQRLPYTTLDYVSVGLNYQTIQIVCTNRRHQYWLTTGDESLTRFFLSSLRRVVEESRLTKEPISILTDATAQMITLRKWAAQESKTEMQNIKLHLYSLVHWEDLADLSMTPDLQLYEPQVSRKGYLDYKVLGNFLTGNSWKKAWFVLRNEMLCRFVHRKNQQPDLSVQLRTPYFGGCRRVRNGERPHSFELIISDGSSLELTCDTEEQVSDWLQAICRVVAQTQVAATSPTHTPSPCQPCCSVITSHKLLICHEDCQTNFYRLLAGVDITDISGLTSDPKDGTYVIVEFQSECAQNPWVFYFNSVKEKAKFESALNSVWREQLQVDLPVIPIDDDRVQKRCCDCSALIQSSWQRSDSLMRGRIGGSMW